MASNYHKLGEYIELVAKTNEKLEYGLNDIIGVTIEKTIIPTIANLKETELSKFSIVEPKNFVYNPRTHGKKIGLGYNNTKNTYIATWNNNTFKIKDSKKGELDPDYLYMFFCRDIWDKEACFNSWGSSTVVFNWDSFCSIKINVPTLEEQKKLVEEYQTIVDRIDVLKRLNNKLETLLDLIYFKYINNANDIKVLDKIAKISAGGDNPVDTVQQPTKECNIPVYSNGNTNDGLFGYTSKAKITTPSITVSARGNIGYTVLHLEPYTPIVRLISISPFDKKDLYWLYFVLKTLHYHDNGTSQQQATIPAFSPLEIKVLDDTNLNVFNETVEPLFIAINQYKIELTKLNKIKQLLISKII